MKQLLSTFAIWGASIVCVRLTKELGRSMHLILLYCHLLGAGGDSNWYPDMSGAQTEMALQGNQLSHASHLDL